ncbi:serine/threonine protein kinase [Georgenia sp. EYE_87]|uniref:serine/threonine-protein kinase n=1 Tax=Georgenia sp. EYE_87 TaxID=2853448 RepID=UPI0020032A0C|nr:serine/threonine-protein kinase [Georgenia sp. EYE_87]MCK6209443.1 serine/threonine protein kinase [Georgenia sp. EYE_87]
MSRRAPAQHPDLPGYTFEKLLGSGGFADVYLYTQHMPHRKVAVKVLTREATEGQPREQFIAEANLMARLSGHSSIVAIHHAGEAADGRPYLVMQYCPLPNLAERLKVRPLGVAEAVGIGVRLAGAVETAHRAGIVHRDIKPANVLTTEYGRPALTDFGIAGMTTATADESAGVSVPWAPPESVEGHAAVGVTGDVYSLAATIYTLLAGHSPFTRPGGPNTRLDYTVRIRRDPVPPIGRGDVPATLERVLARGMAKLPAHRYASALDLGRALQVVEQELRLPMTDIEVPDTSWLGGGPGAAPAPDGGDNRTVVRQVVEIDPHRAGAAAATGRPRPEAVTALRGAAGADDGWDEGTEGATQLRGARSAEPEAAEVEPAAPRRRRLALVGGGVALALVVVGGIVGAGALRGEPEDETTAPAATAIPIPAQVPSPVDLTGTRDGETVTFTWGVPAELDAEEGVTFTWQRTEPGADPQVHPAQEPQAVVEGATGQVCLSVKIRLPNGTTSTSPAQTCVQ